MENVYEIMERWNHSSGSLEQNSHTVERVMEFLFTEEELESLEPLYTISDYEKCSAVYKMVHELRKEMLR
ncbi:hypothetical protein IMZ31_22050 (plasmid) [Pontibacillus sp. ALD_SL1]|uniref:hypothetical protein n=1 Tax=Pontibacillus sp. ALD_SL1 TaxID=2777185 RepID=UPI001A95E5B0|nr:hypothetical protein [Pontibacillus sp. ALD_SL1]QST02137.1 hypothetical protein IMZ31_22050 [Pontibacillus sp. ALD_SL1]